jgi:hypothetical protein
MVFGFQVEPAASPALLSLPLFHGGGGEEEELGVAANTRNISITMERFKTGGNL